MTFIISAQREQFDQPRDYRNKLPSTIYRYTLVNIYSRGPNFDFLERNNKKKKQQQTRSKIFIEPKKNTVGAE